MKIKQYFYNRFIKMISLHVMSASHKILLFLYYSFVKTL